MKRIVDVVRETCHGRRPSVVRVSVHIYMRLFMDANMKYFTNAPSW